MHVDYIRNLSEAFIIDNPDCTKGLKTEDLAEHFYSVIKEIREYQPDLYDIIESKNKFEQQKIITNYFKLLLNSNQDLEDKPITEDTVILTEFVGSGLEFFVFSPVFFTLLYYYFRKPISKITMNIIFGIIQTAKNIGKALSNYGNNVRMAYVIINQNAEKCYEKVGFNPKDATFKYYFSQYPIGSLLNDFSRVFTSRFEEIKMDGLRQCFMYSLKESIKLMVSSYFICLRNTGSLSKLPLERDYLTFTKLITKSKLIVECSEFIKDLNSAFKQFNQILSLIYYDKDNKIMEEKQDLMNSIYGIQKSVLNNDNKFNIRTYPQDSNRT